MTEVWRGDGRMDRVQATGKIRKRKAENQDNERLSKRLSLLNLERNGQRLYVPVEQPSSAASSKPMTTQLQPQQDDVMQLDDTKHKVYIYDLDAELSDSESSDDGRLVFLPDIEKHLRESRIPPMLLANSEGELAGNNQLILYNIPSSLTIPEEQDSVRKAIIETRARARAKQEEKRKENTRTSQTNSNLGGLDAPDWYNWYKGIETGNAPSMEANGMGDEPMAPTQDNLDNDPNAMDLG